MELIRALHHNMSARSDKSIFYCHSSVFTSLTQTNPLHDVHDHPTEGYLKRSQVGVDWQDLDNFQVTRNHPRTKQALRYEEWIVGVPVFPENIIFQSRGFISSATTSWCRDPVRQQSPWRPCSRRWTSGWSRRWNSRLWTSPPGSRGLSRTQRVPGSVSVVRCITIIWHWRS